MAVIFRFKGGRIIPIKVDEEQTTNDYMNNKIRNNTKKMTINDYIKKKEQEQQPLLQEFGYKPKEEKYRSKAERLLDKFNRRNKGVKK